MQKLPWEGFHDAAIESQSSQKMHRMRHLSRLGIVLAGAALIAIAGCSKSLPTDALGSLDTAPGTTISADSAGSGRESTPSYLSYKGFVYPQCTYTAAYWFDKYPQSKVGFPSPGHNWRGNACAWDQNAYAAGWVVWWGSPNVSLTSVRLRLAGAILVWDATSTNPAGHVGVIWSCDAGGAWVRESNWPKDHGEVTRYLSWSTIFNRSGYRLKGFVLRERR